ncbi:hypothetical protein FA362_25950 [Pseudomonas aeruginosa]|uniref:hypothetical protein n=1 Tax=Pseudomonas aeruginosa TaxID=287 RepID=UPI000F53D63B|nr:hypothetical protein [Pseudomonas aeruginosa]EIU1411949.1 hypothetical protein [Pseudomonas aeruginosa]EKV3024559.1 hypothetical protein [Pseudomonas aeruginosa]MBC9053321.1 hypothetical protein [Pseudomonas aeruginosa]MBG4519686.1 hypothetical protein [Pseudomonas aeruginosa]MBX6182648.1 hypothetical protein [Pseudomonas aeruginosa]
MLNEISLIVSFSAAIISGLSLAVSIYSTHQDRARIHTRSEIFYDATRGLEPAPSMRVIIVNAGRRPIIMTRFVIISEQGNWFTPLRELGAHELQEVVTEARLLIEKFVAQNTSIRLSEGDIFELIIHHDDDRILYSFFEDSQREAKDIQIEDVLGRRYWIKDAKKNISNLKSFFSNT